LLLNSYLIYWKIKHIIYVESKKIDSPSLIGGILLQIYLFYRVFIMKKVEPTNSD